MAFSVISNFVFEPQLASEYASAAFIEKLSLLQKSGLIVQKGLDGLQSTLGEGGEFIDMPYFPTIASLVSIRDLTSTTAPSDLDLTGATQKGVILRRKAGPVKFTDDIYIRGVTPGSAEHEVGKQIGNLSALEVQQCIFRVLFGAIPTANVMTSIYVTTGTKGLMTYATLHGLRMKLNDAYNKLTHVIMHSDVFADLVVDGLTTYKVENVGGYSIVTGDPRALGMTYVVIDDASLKVTNGGSFKKYYTYCMGPAAMQVIYQKRLTINSERRLDFEAPYTRVLANFDFAAHLNHTKWNSSSNPSNANLADPTKWDDAFGDHREVLLTRLEHNATAA